MQGVPTLGPSPESIQPVPLPDCVLWSKRLPHSEPQYPHLQNGKAASASSCTGTWRVKGTKSHRKCFCQLRRALWKGSANSVSLGESPVQRLVCRRQPSAETLANAVS